MKNRIVSEVSRNWTGEKSDLNKLLLSQTFEQIIATNAQRGFTLESWQFQMTEVETIGGDPGILETIVAVFVEY